MVSSFSVYPERLDGYATLPLVRNLVDEIRAEDHNRLRDAIVKIESELGVQPSGTFATVRARLDEIGDVRALLLAHLADTTDAHDASAISVVDSPDNYFEDDVEGILEELGALVPPQPDVIGADNSNVPNDGIPDWFDGYGTKFAFNVSSTANVLKRTQPTAVAGIQITEVSSTTDDGYGARLEFFSDGGTLGVGTEQVRWRAPGDSFGASVDVSSLAAGDTATLQSGTSTKRVRVARTSASFAVAISGLGDDFAIYSLDAKDGFFSLPSEGFKSTKFITRTSSSVGGTSRFQFMVSGAVFPADRGTLVLQRKLRGASAFFPIAVLDLSTNFVEAARVTGQQVYTPSLASFDTILLYDRFPVKEDYSLLNKNANNENVFDDYENDFSRLQVAHYAIPVSNPDIVGGELAAPADTTEAEANNEVSAYRVLHYIAGVTDFTGQPATTDLFSVIDDSVSGSSEGHHPTRISNIVVDDSATRPVVEHVNLRPVTINPATGKFISGIKYYIDSATADHKFDVELRSNNDVFNSTYVRQSILTFDTDVFNFPNGIDDGYWGAQVDVDELLDDGYTQFSSANLPGHSDQAFYFAVDAAAVAALTPPQDRRIYPAPNQFSTRAHVTATMHDPFGAGDGYDAYGADLITRVLVNSFSTTRATDTAEWFTDESQRVDDTHNFDGPTDLDTTPGFTSNAALASISLQCGGRFTTDEFNTPGLIYPQDDYTTGNGIGPGPQLSGTDYSVVTGDKTYRRLFTLGRAVSSGSLRIVSGGNSLVSFDDIRFKRAAERDRFGKIEVRIPGRGTPGTGWLDIGRLFSTGSFEDGDGALSGAVTGSAGDFTVPFTFGTRNNGDTENNIAVRVTYFGQDAGERSTSRQKIITLLQLLA